MVDDAERSMGLKEVLQGIAIGALIGGVTTLAGHLQDPANVSFTSSALQKMVAIFISGGAGGTLSYLAGHHLGFRKGYEVVPPREPTARTRRSDLTVVVAPAPEEPKKTE